MTRISMALTNPDIGHTELVELDRFKTIFDYSYDSERTYVDWLVDWVLRDPEGLTRIGMTQAKWSDIFLASATLNNLLEPAKSAPWFLTYQGIQDDEFHIGYLNINDLNRALDMTGAEFGDNDDD